jgi:hypothetical protein
VTEVEWLTATDPAPMLKVVRDKASDRKLRLFGVACCRMVWQDFQEERIRRLVDVSEEFADGIANLQQLQSVRQEAERAYASNQGDSGNQDVEEAALGLGERLDLTKVLRWAVYSTVFFDVESWLRRCDSDADQDGKNRAFAVALDQQRIRAKTAHAALLHDIFGNPFRPVVVGPRWLTSSVVDLARSIYEADPRQAGGYMGMPILADALMDAGCDNDDILNHCRGEGPHVRGCWVLDLLTGRA